MLHVYILFSFYYYFCMFCSSISMGKEVVEMFTDEESDCVLISSASDNPEEFSNDASKYFQLPGLDKKGMGNPDCEGISEDLGSKEEAAMEDSMAYLVGISINEANSSPKEQELPCVRNLNLGAETEEKKKVNIAEQKTTNGSSLDHHMKLASKQATSANIKTSHTVSQPFAPETNKRASGGSRLLAPNVAVDEKKNSNSNGLQSQNLVKKAQVIFFSLLIYVLTAPHFGLFSGNGLLRSYIFVILCSIIASINCAF